LLDGGIAYADDAGCFARRQHRVGCGHDLVYT
jgi:hypothetical protein